MKFFKLKEFDCHCKRGIACNAAPMQPAFLEKVDQLRAEWGQPLLVTSGRRCLARNTKVGGAPNSRHLVGEASDFHFDDPADTKKFAQLAEKWGFNGIGLGVHLCHIDTRPGTLIAHWTYDI